MCVERVYPFESQVQDITSTAFFNGSEVISPKLFGQLVLFS